jgi:hypothetical protein
MSGMDPMSALMGGGGGQNSPMGAPPASPSQSLVSSLWPNSGMQGAMNSPFLPIVSPLIGQSDPMSSLMGMMPGMSDPLGPASITTPPAKGPAGASNPSALGSIFSSMGTSMGKG